MIRRLGKRTHNIYSLAMYTVIFAFVGIVLLYGATDLCRVFLGNHRFIVEVITDLKLFFGKDENGFNDQKGSTSLSAKETLTHIPTLIAIKFRLCTILLSPICV